MNNLALVIGTATVLLALGMWLMLPRGNARGDRTGALLGLIGLGLLASQLPRLALWGPAGGWDDDLGDLVFLTLAAVTIVASVATISLHNPVYCAIWFALSLLGTAGLFFYQGSQFLGMATIVVYAGAILVTFLFVLMLAQPGGHSYYDRISWEGLLSATTGAVMVGILTTVVVRISSSERIPTALGDAVEHSPQDLEKNILAEEHMAHLGAELFGRHLIAVEVAGTLLLVALVGGVAILARDRTLATAGVGTSGHSMPSGMAGKERGDDGAGKLRDQPAGSRTHG